jgi:hypothetical protein
VLDNNNPPETPATNDHNDPGPNRRPAAANATPIASRASPTAEPPAAIGPKLASRRWAQELNNTRIRSARAEKRRNQPRTVSAGTPAHPLTSALDLPSTNPATNAPPITAATSRRRNNATVANNTDVTPQNPHRPRRGRNTTTDPRSRRTRRRANPHGRNRPTPHDPQR